MTTTKQSEAVKTVNKYVCKERINSYNALASWCHDDLLAMYDLQVIIYRKRQSTDNFAVMQAIMFGMQQHDIQAGREALI